MTAVIYSITDHFAFIGGELKAVSFAELRMRISANQSTQMAAIKNLIQIQWHLHQFLYENNPKQCYLLL
jgi:hypothetical protein